MKEKKFKVGEVITFKRDHKSPFHPSVTFNNIETRIEKYFSYSDDHNCWRISTSETSDYILLESDFVEYTANPYHPKYILAGSNYMTKPEGHKSAAWNKHYPYNRKVKVLSHGGYTENGWPVHTDSGLFYEEDFQLYDRSTEERAKETIEAQAYQNPMINKPVIISSGPFIGEIGIATDDITGNGDIFCVNSARKLNHTLNISATDLTLYSPRFNYKDVVRVLEYPRGTYLHNPALTDLRKVTFTIHAIISALGEIKEYEIHSYTGRKLRVRPYELELIKKYDPTDGVAEHYNSNKGINVDPLMKLFDENSKGNKCPQGYVFGNDWDLHDKCVDCDDQIWDDCSDHCPINAKRKGIPKLKHKSEKRFKEKLDTSDELKINPSIKKGSTLNLNN